MPLLKRCRFYSLGPVVVPVAITIPITIVVPISIAIISVSITVPIVVPISVAMFLLCRGVAFLCLSGYNDTKILLFVQQGLAELTPIGGNGAIFKVVCEETVIVAFLGNQNLVSERSIARLIISPSKIS